MNQNPVYSKASNQPKEANPIFAILVVSVSFGIALVYSNLIPHITIKEHNGVTILWEQSNANAAAAIQGNQLILLDRNVISSVNIWNGDINWEIKDIVFDAGMPIATTEETIFLGKNGGGAEFYLDGSVAQRGQFQIIALDIMSGNFIRQSSYEGAALVDDIAIEDGALIVYGNQGHSVLPQRITINTQSGIVISEEDGYGPAYPSIWNRQPLPQYAPQYNTIIKDMAVTETRIAYLTDDGHLWLLDQEKLEAKNLAQFAPKYSWGELGNAHILTNGELIAVYFYASDHLFVFEII